MNEDLISEQRLTYAVTAEEITLKVIQQVCKQVFLAQEQMNVEYLVLSRADHKTLSDVITEATNIFVIAEPGALEKPVSQLVTKCLNQTTGTLMDIYSSFALPQGTLIFGTYHDNSSAPTLSQEDILSGKF